MFIIWEWLSVLGIFSSYNNFTWLLANYYTASGAKNEENTAPGICRKQQTQQNCKTVFP